MPNSPSSVLTRLERIEASIRTARGWNHSRTSFLLDDLEFLGTQLRTALQDSQRLDWMQANEVHVNHVLSSRDGLLWAIDAGAEEDSEAPTLRAAIDAALSSIKGAPRP